MAKVLVEIKGDDSKSGGSKKRCMCCKAEAGTMETFKVIGTTQAVERQLRMVTAPGICLCEMCVQIFHELINPKFYRALVINPKSK